MFSPSISIPLPPYDPYAQPQVRIRHDSYPEPQRDRSVDLPASFEDQDPIDSEECFFGSPPAHGLR